MPTVAINGEDLCYEDTAGEGPAILFSHGFLMDHEMFAPQVAALKRRYRCVSWDQRAHGGSTARGEFTYWDSAADAIALLDHLGIASAVLCGMSQGGFLSMRAALSAPERVNALVLIDTQAGLEPEALLPLYDAMRDEWMANGPGNVKESVAFSILGPPCDPIPWFDKWEKLPRESLAFAYRCLTSRDDITSRLGEIRCPTLVVHGRDDVAIPIESAETLCNSIPGCAGLVVVEGGTHASNLSHPEIVNQAMEEFLGNLVL